MSDTIQRHRPAPMQRVLQAGARMTPVVLVLALWQASVASGLVDGAFLPSVGATVTALWEMLRNGEIATNLAVSVYRAFVGLAIGSALGVALGAAMAVSRAADGFFGPLVAITYSLPKSALVPLFLLWFGIGDVTNILTVVLACLLPVVVSTYHGVKAAPEILVWSAQAMGASRARILWGVLLPAAALSILTGVRIALGFCFVLVISSEMIAAKVGIGKLVFFYGESGAYAHMFAGLATVVTVAFLADRLLLAAMAHMLRWHDGVNNGSQHA